MSTERYQPSHIATPNGIDFSLEYASGTMWGPINDKEVVSAIFLGLVSGALLAPVFFVVMGKRWGLVASAVAFVLLIMVWWLVIVTLKAGEPRNWMYRRLHRWRVWRGGQRSFARPRGTVALIGRPKLRRGPFCGAGASGIGATKLAHLVYGQPPLRVVDPDRRKVVMCFRRPEPATGTAAVRRVEWRAEPRDLPQGTTSIEAPLDDLGFRARQFSHECAKPVPERWSRVQAGLERPTAPVRSGWGMTPSWVTTIREMGILRHERGMLLWLNAMMVVIVLGLLTARWVQRNDFFIYQVPGVEEAGTVRTKWGQPHGN